MGPHQDLMRQAMALEQMGDLQRAVALLTESNLIQPAVDMLARNRRFNDAARLLLSALGHPLEALVYLSVEQQRAALFAAELHQKGSLFFNAAKIYIALNQEEAAAQVQQACNDLLSQYPSASKMYRHLCGQAIRLAHLLQDLSFDLDFALTDFVASDPQTELEFEALYLLAELYRDLEQLENAQEQLERLLGLHPDHPQCMQLLAEIREQRMGAEADYERVLEEERDFRGDYVREMDLSISVDSLPALPDLPSLPSAPSLPQAQLPQLPGQHPTRTSHHGAASFTQPPPTQPDLRPRRRSGPLPPGEPRRSGGFPPQRGTPQRHSGALPQGRLPPQQGGFPPQRSTARQSGTLPPQQGGFPPPQGGFPPPQGGFPPPQGGFPPPQGGFPPPQGGFPPPSQRHTNPQRQSQLGFASQQALPAGHDSPSGYPTHTKGPGSQTRLPQGTASRVSHEKYPDTAYEFIMSHIPPQSVFAGRYRIGELIGRGGMAFVFQAYDTMLQEQVALKVINPLSSEKSSHHRFVRELKLSRRLTHPNIATLYDIGQDRGFFFISMELLIGCNLEEFVFQQTADIRRGLSYLIQACEGLFYAHEHGVIHRDIKSSNLFLLDNGHIKLLDFGLAKLNKAPSQTDTKTFLGTSLYVAPEQIRDFRTATPLADLYSLGIVAFELFTGRLPFEHEEVIPVLMMHLEQPPPSPRGYRSELPPEVEEVIMRCLEKDPRRRYQSAKQLSQHLQQILQAL